MNRSLVFLLFLAPAAILAIRCWSGMETVSNGRRLPAESGGPFASVECNADFCYNNYVKRHTKGDDSYTVTKSCGEVGKCFETGCDGPHDERICCCIGDLCNSSNGLNNSVAGILIILTTYLLFR
ncbi:unnamed protein product [Caenorhabditis bovis]|uniref:UPAR/Ly6 domain-containing protein n=1 Tax=Caenorhabditis bovis TaxID=2654633 RepID=A0A8S1F7M8_9PELO|nr:unnamed protein product [Caenorhabditis bovis]